MSSPLSAMLSRLLDAALALPPEQRLAWVDELAEEYEALKPRLRVLIERSAAIDASSMFDTLPKLALDVEQPVMRFTAHIPGKQIGQYRLQRCLGSGAMGVVWLAERTDGVPPREVALKFAVAGPRSSQLPARLAREQQLMAALDHPNVARLYSAGLTPEGHPYLVLEYVAGVPLHAYCREYRPDLAERLRLFLQIGRAVAHAHECQIVHRDLKPANVMVCTGDGAGGASTVRLLDFGIGKLLTDGLPIETQLSLLSGRPLTPAYASPEQLVGADAGMPSDVYSLGVMLYELLAGAMPYDYRRDSNRALRHAILQVDPPAPCARIQSELDPRQRTELDAIVLRALHKRPELRYPSAREFVAALESLFGSGFERFGE
jgi:eukaryotic-like serine/threonine-protein kinase